MSHWPGEVEEHAGAEELPLLRLLDRQGEDALEAEAEDGEGQVPVVGVILHVHHPGQVSRLSNTHNLCPSPTCTLPRAHGSRKYI